MNLEEQESPYQGECRAARVLLGFGARTFVEPLVLGDFD
jgi:hypothetical protein